MPAAEAGDAAARADRGGAGARLHGRRRLPEMCVPGGGLEANADPRFCVPEGHLLWFYGDAVDADGETWRYALGTGWVAARYTKPDPASWRPKRRPRVGSSSVVVFGDVYNRRQRHPRGAHGPRERPTTSGLHGGAVYPARDWRAPAVYVPGRALRRVCDVGHDAENDDPDARQWRRRDHPRACTRWHGRRTATARQHRRLYGGLQVPARVDRAGIAQTLHRLGQDNTSGASLAWAADYHSVFYGAVSIERQERRDAGATPLARWPH